MRRRAGAGRRGRKTGAGPCAGPLPTIYLVRPDPNTPMRNPLTPLGGTEMEVLRDVWALGRATARDVHDRVSARRKVAYTTVMTVMKNLAEKGYLTYDADGVAYVYEAAVPPEEVRASVLDGILDKVFGGSASSLVQALVHRESLSDDDRAEIRRLIDGIEDAPTDAPDSDA